MWKTPLFSHSEHHLINSSSPGQNGHHFADDTFKLIFLNEKNRFLTTISPKFVPKGPIDSNPTLVYIMAWHRICDKPLSEPMWTLTHICGTRGGGGGGGGVLLLYLYTFISANYFAAPLTLRTITSWDETLSVLLVLCKKNPPVTGGLPWYKSSNAEPLYVLFVVSLNKLLREWSCHDLRRINAHVTSL